MIKPYLDIVFEYFLTNAAAVVALMENKQVYTCNRKQDIIQLQN